MWMVLTPVPDFPSSFFPSPHCCVILGKFPKIFWCSPMPEGRQQGLLRTVGVRLRQEGPCETLGSLRRLEKSVLSKWCHCCIINGRIKTRAFLTLLLDSYISLYGNIHNQSSLCLGFPIVIFTVPSPAEPLLWTSSPGAGSSPARSPSLWASWCTCPEEHPGFFPAGRDGFRQSYRSVLWYHLVSVSPSQTQPFPLCLVKGFFFLPPSLHFFIISSAFSSPCLPDKLTLLSPWSLLSPSPASLLTDEPTWFHAGSVPPTISSKLPWSLPQSGGVIQGPSAIRCLWQDHISHQVLWSQ